MTNWGSRLSINYNIISVSGNDFRFCSCCFLSKSSLSLLVYYVIVSLTLWVGPGLFVVLLLCCCCLFLLLLVLLLLCWCYCCFVCSATTAAVVIVDVIVVDGVAGVVVELVFIASLLY